MAEPPLRQVRSDFPPPPSDEIARASEETLSFELSSIEEILEESVLEIETWSDREKEVQDVRVRLALLAITVTGDPQRAIELLLPAMSHPLAFMLATTCAVQTGDLQCMEKVQKTIENYVPKHPVEKLARNKSLCTIAEAWAYGFDSVERSADIVVDILRSDSNKIDVATWSLASIVLPLAGRWHQMVEHLSNHSCASMSFLLDGMSTAFDRLGDTHLAAKIWDLIETKIRDTPDYDNRILLAIFDLAWAIALQQSKGSGDSQLFEREKVATEWVKSLAAQHTDARYAAATKFLLAEVVCEEAPDFAARLFADISERSDADWGPIVARMKQLYIAIGNNTWPTVVKILEQLCDDAADGFRYVYRRRIAQVLDVYIQDSERTLASWELLMQDMPNDSWGALVCERLSLHRTEQVFDSKHYWAPTGESPPNELSTAAIFRSALRAEIHEKDPARAIALLAEAQQDGANDIALALARLYRKLLNTRQQAETLRRAANTVDRRIRASLYCAIGAVELSERRTTEAEDAFRSALKQYPKDLVSRLGMVVLYRRASRWRDLVRLLHELVPDLENENTKLRALRELGRVCATKLRDATRAQKALEQALELSPSDAGTLHALAELHDSKKEWKSAVKMRRQAIQASSNSSRHALLLFEIGQIEERHNKNTDAALAAYESSFAADPLMLDALRARARIYRKRRDTKSLLGVLETELEATKQPSRRVSLQLEIAGLHLRHQNTKAALRAYRCALDGDPKNEEGLAGVRKLARAEGDWALIVEVFRDVSQNAENLHVLAEAHRNMQNWNEFVDIRQQQVKLAEQQSDKARFCYEIGETYRDKLQDADRAIVLYQRSLEYDDQFRDSYTALIGLLEKRKRWQDLVRVLRKDISATPKAQTKKRVERLMQLADVYRNQISSPEHAIETLEEILVIDSSHEFTLSTLEDLYREENREDDLLRIMYAHAQACQEPAASSALFAEVAQLRRDRGDIDEAIRAFHSAFDADPTNRSLFSALEKLAYEKSRWDVVMSLYNKAIDLVQNKKFRAYRLGDLFARRGRVQLKFLKQPTQAAMSYLQVVEKDPANEDAVATLETIYTDQEDWRSLKELYERRASLLHSTSQRHEALMRAAEVVESRLLDRKSSMGLYEKILAENPNNDQAMEALEKYYEKNAEWGKLVKILKRRLSKGSTDRDKKVALHRRIARISEEMLRNEEQAVAHYLHMLVLAPSNKRALESLGRIYESTEQWAEFVDVTRKQIRVTTDRNVKALLYFKCGSVMEAKFGKEQEAIRYYDAAIKTAPSCLPAVHGLRDLYRRRKDWPRVIQSLELEVKLWQDDKERAGVFAQIGRIYSEQLGQPNRAMHYYESALAVDRECLPANRALFDHYFESQDWDRAQPLADTLAQKAMRVGDPSQRSEFYCRRGIVLQMTGAMQAAGESLMTALELNPANLDALVALGALARAEPDLYDFAATYQELERIYKKRTDRHPHLAQVRVAQAMMKEREGDLDAAESIYQQACKLAPADFSVVSAMVALHINMRRWELAVEAITLFLQATPNDQVDVRVKALVYLAEIRADYEMNSEAAVLVLRQVMELDPTHQDAPYRLAQEYYLLGRFAEARAGIEKAIQLAADPGKTVIPENLARYYYYLGRIIEAGGEAHAATSQYRRAAEYDPAYAPPVLALAKRAADRGQPERAEKLLIDAAHAAMKQTGALAAVPLQRGLARILLATGNRLDAIEAYRGILNVDKKSGGDRVALAQIYAQETLPKAISELIKVIDADIRHAPAYRLLASYYQKLGETERFLRVLSAMEALGFAGSKDRALMDASRKTLPGFHIRGNLEHGDCLQLLVSEAFTSTIGKLWKVICREVSTLFAPPAMGENVIPVQSVHSKSFRRVEEQMKRAFGVECETYVGDNVPSGVAVVSFPRPIVVVDSEIVAESELAKRFMFGYAFEAIRGNFGLLLSLGHRQRMEFISLIRSLFQQESERVPRAREFIRSLPPTGVRMVDSLEEQVDVADVESWMGGMEGIAKKSWISLL